MKHTWTLDAVLFAVVTGHLLLAPYTKVEESFTIQAVHDIVNHGVYPPQVLQNYDHTTFPGVVPRTFVGSVVIAGVVKIVDFIYGIVTGTSLVTDGSSQIHVQIVARAVLALANVWGLRRLRNGLSALVSRSKTSTGPAFFTLLLAAQFHVLFYASRTLPNFVVLPVVNLGLSKLLVGDLRGLTWLAFGGAVFRLEVGVFAAIIALVHSLVFGQSNVFQAFFMLAAGSAVGLAVSYSVDSYFWGAPTLPELQAFIFNVVQGKSVEWGVEPYAAYFSKYIPNFFRPPHVLFLAIFGLLSDPAATNIPVLKSTVVVTHPARHSLRILAISAVLFVLVMSLQPHKEWRFIIYVAPIATLLAGHGLARVWLKTALLVAYKIFFVLMLASTLVSFAISSFMAYASSHNYPGGQAIAYINTILADVPASTNVTVHMDAPACMTGVTRFAELHRPNIVYDKTETELSLAKIWNDVDFLITHKNMQEPLASDVVIYDPSHWDLLHQVPAFAGVNLQAPLRLFQLLATKKSARELLVAQVWAELQQGKFTTLQNLLGQSIVLKRYLYVYKRTALDPMPTILDVNPIDESAQLEEVLTQEYEHHLENQIDPQDIQELVNQQIDHIEEAVENSHFSDEL